MEFAAYAKATYGQCKAVCESTGNHWIKTVDAFESAEIPLMLANPFKIKAIAGASMALVDFSDQITKIYHQGANMAYLTFEQPCGEYHTFEHLGEIWPD